MEEREGGRVRKGRGGRRERCEGGAESTGCKEEVASDWLTPPVTASTHFPGRKKIV